MCKIIIWKQLDTLWDINMKGQFEIRQYEYHEAQEGDGVSKADTSDESLKDWVDQETIVNEDKLRIEQKYVYKSWKSN